MLLVSVQQGISKMLSIHHGLKIILISSLLCSMPVHAQNNYLFPSDIADQYEQSQYDIGRAERYENQRQWLYPLTNQASGTKPVTADNRQYSNDAKKDVFGQYNPYSEPQMQYKSLNSTQPSSGSDWSGQSERYKYGHFSKNHSQQSSPNATYSDYPANLRYSSDDGVNPYRSHQYVHESKNANERHRVQARNSAHQRNISRSESDLLYPSDVEKNRYERGYNQYKSNYYNSNVYDESNLQAKQVNQNVQIKYIPVPVYRVPGTLPGTIPGVVTPGSMVPGYSHLSPNYDFGGMPSGLNQALLNQGLLSRGLSSHSILNQNLLNQRLLNQNLLNHNLSNTGSVQQILPQSVFQDSGAFGGNSFNSTRYNPLSGPGVFPGESNPFDSFYKTYDNHSRNTSPFAVPDSMTPGFSMPSMFSSQ